jgi:hypothetical protein
LPGLPRPIPKSASIRLKACSNNPGIAEQGILLSTTATVSPLLVEAFAGL